MAVVRLTVLPDMLLLGITYMEKTMKKLIIMTAILVGLMAPATAEIEIKGFKLEMDKKEKLTEKSNLHPCKFPSSPKPSVHHVQVVESASQLRSVIIVQKAALI